MFLSTMDRWESAKPSPEWVSDATHGDQTTKSAFFTLASIPNEEIYCSRKFCIVLREGPKNLLFEDEATNGSIAAGEEEDFNGIDQAVFSVENQPEDNEGDFCRGIDKET